MKVLVVAIGDATLDDVELASDQLWQRGVSAIEERTVTNGVELWTVVGESHESIERVVAGLDSRWPWRVEEVNPEPAETWREFASPMWATADLVVVPAWQEHSFDGHVLALRIEPGSAFGLGDHPTTELSLRSLYSLMSTRPEHPMTVLDVGCGTGVLAIAAVRLGATRARAVDVAASAVEATLDNAARNGVSDQVDVDMASLADLEGDYEIVVANILAPVIVGLAGQLRRLTAPDGRLIISGILADEHTHVLEALAPMTVVHREVLDGWAAVTLKH